MRWAVPQTNCDEAHTARRARGTAWRADPRLAMNAYPAFILCNRSRNLCDWHFAALQYDY